MTHTHDTITWSEVAKEFGFEESYLRDSGIIDYIHAPQVIRMAKEIIRLRRVIAQELSENDEIGSEYTYVLVLKGENERLRLALKTIREMEEKKTCSHSIASSWSVADNALNQKGFGCD